MNSMEEVIAAFLHEKLSDKENIRVLDLKDITSGWETDIYSFTLEYRDSGADIRKDLILRLYSGKYATQSAKNEFQTLSELHKIDYPVPFPYFLGVEPSYVDKPFIIMERINGQPLGERMQTACRDEFSDLMYLFCNLFYTLHRLNWNIINIDFSLDQKNPKHLLLDYFLQFRQEIRHFKKEEFLPIIEWLDNIPKMSAKYLSIFHGDFHPNNILITAENEAYVIDWHRLSIKDFRMDLGWTLVLCEAHISSDFRHNVLNIYQNLYGSKVPNIEYFEVLACLRRLFDLSVSLSSGAAEMGMRDETKEVMKQYIPAFKKVYKLLNSRTGLVIPEIEALLLK
ncbi:MAG: phosphotransferase family protein [Promethearchaeota archaeon]